MPMKLPTRTIFLGDTPQKGGEKIVRGEYVPFLGEAFYKIWNYDAIEPFFMSIVSSSDHWLFVSTTGGLTAGRISPEQSLFPYYTVDKITENAENTGNKAILHVRRANRTSLWEPFLQSCTGNYRIERSIYKNISSTTVIFEEINHDLGLAYRYAWRTSEKFGFIKTTWLLNLDNSACQVEFVDGLQNIMPANVSMATQNTFSCLLDAYKRSELDRETGLAIFALNSTLTDLAEPSESLLATTVAQLGLDRADYLLSSLQLDRFRYGQGVATETEVRGRRGFYFIHTMIDLEAGAERTWHLMADVCQDSAAIVQTLRALRGDKTKLLNELEQDIANNQSALKKIIAQADGIQLSKVQLCTAHHFADVMFNVMRGGAFTEQYWVRSEDLRESISLHSPGLLNEQADFFARLPEKIQTTALQALAEETNSPDLSRLCTAYLPLTFSRRHGDPSRPWNLFRINVKNPDGTRRLDYEGNWRDIFQNWEALATSFPEFVEGMISVFLNATTLDGYNPYRITSRGIDWEIPEPHNPWANIGYWSDHQIIYLQKLMEISARVHPGKLQKSLARPIFSYANVPYRIKPYITLLQDPYNTIEFDWELQRAIDTQIPQKGMDARLVYGPDGQVLHVSLAEKLLTLLLAKLANFVPEGGIWMNTQRPEWNDANNALVGKGLSVVTLCYLRRYLAFCSALFISVGEQEMPVGLEVASFYAEVTEILERFKPILAGSFSDDKRREMMDALGQAGSNYRWQYYSNGIAGRRTTLTAAEIGRFFELAQAYVDHSLRSNRRADSLYHAYNILQLSKDRAGISRLYEMLEGQVAILSSGLLSGEETLALLNALKTGPLFRADQHSYILYPDREVSGFLERNRIVHGRVKHIKLVQALVAGQDNTLINRDAEGNYHFSGHIRNINDVNKALVALQDQPQFAEYVAMEADKIRGLFEEVFHHDEFTGRSSTFFAYEGLGSIYWHMVSKLQLAVQESIDRVRNESSSKELSQALRKIYQDIRQGSGYLKTPEQYGAFPTDPYSHTPKGQGAKQPGMTGQVKEEILIRFAELGLSIRDGRFIFDPFLLDPDELLRTPSIFTWLDTSGKSQTLELCPDSLAYTYCQVPVILHFSSETPLGIDIYYSDGEMKTIPGRALDAATSEHIFRRDGQVHHLCVHFRVE
jgi:hypothetical protein